MTLSKDSLKWAIEFLDRHSDGDIFPSIPEISAIRSSPDKLIDALRGEFSAGLGPMPSRRFIVPNDDLSYRQATQLHPQDSILLTAAVYQYGRGIEDRRLGTDTIFSYRFDPDVKHGLYGARGLWNDFWSLGIEMSDAYSHVLYCDVADFYNQISHHSVENQLMASDFPKPVCKWINSLLGSTTAKVSRGLPIGPHAAHLIAESTLIPIDNSLKTNGITFIRYSDDILVFCPSHDEAKRALQTIATILDKQQRLSLQRHKTRILVRDEFRDMYGKMVEDRPISLNEDRVLNIIRKYSGGNPYAAVTYNQVSAEDWKQFSEDIVRGIIDEYLGQDAIDHVRLRWFFRRLAQVGHPGAMKVVVDNIAWLVPCLPSVCSYITSLQSIPPDEWREVGTEVLRFLEPGSHFDTEFGRLSLLSLFSKNRDIDHFGELVQMFSASDPYARREILLAAKTNSQVDWLREHKETYESMDPWQKIAFVYCSSILPEDERQHFLRRSYPSSFLKELAAWSMSEKPT